LTCNKEVIVEIPKSTDPVVQISTKVPVSLDNKKKEACGELPKFEDVTVSMPFIKVLPSSCLNYQVQLPKILVEKIIYSESDHVLKSKPNTSSEGIVGTYVITVSSTNSGETASSSADL
jgi:hypothetical protein